MKSPAVQPVGVVHVGRLIVGMAVPMTVPANYCHSAIDVRRSDNFGKQ